MRLLFDEELEEVIERKGEQRDPEMTLGSWTLLGIFFVLAVVCGLCFALGYALGRHSQPQTQATQASQTSEQADSSKSKPSANSQPVTAAQTQSPEASLEEHSDGDEPAAAAPPALKPVPTPALPSAITPAKAPASKVQSAIPQASAGPLMVQIAVLSHPEDADVLVGALHKRGYNAQAHREPADGLIHVRVGPFQDRAEAEQWRQKLLNDGYNAIVQ